MRADFRIDVTGAVELEGPLETAISVFAPPTDQLAAPPAIVFGFPGGGYSRGYFDIQHPGFTGYSQAEHHAARGYVLVACDHLGVGDSTICDLSQLSYANLSAANHATVEQVTARLEAGTLIEGLRPVRGALKIGMGQSMGGCLTIAQQAYQRSFDGIAVLGYSAIHTVVPTPPGSRAEAPDTSSPAEAFRWAFHWEDVPRELVDADLKGDYPGRGGDVPMWGSATVPGCANAMLLPGTIEREAAAVDVPVFVGVGERDVVPDPHAEPPAYRGASDITLYIQPRAAHMHNFAGSRALLWDRLVAWIRSI